ncbi:MAG: glutathione peroxidase [Calditrichaceae bacterium]
MKFLTVIFTLFVFTGIGCLQNQKEAPMTEKMQSSIYNIPVKDIDGNPLTLSKYKGKALLIVNVASKCGFTPQYKGLESLYETYKDSGLVVLGFPANNFNHQEPGTNEQIKQFCTTNFNVTFPMFSKISVKGGDKHPLYQYLTEQKTDPKFAGDITWNFNKFLIDRNGNIVARFDSAVTPQSDQVIQAVRKVL